MLGLTIVTAFSAGALAQKLGAFTMTTKYVKLTEPLLLHSAGQLEYFHLLPQGTPMYKDISFAEGHTRYIVYVNIKGPFESESVVSEHRNWVEPIWAHRVAKDEVKTLVNETPISKDDLSRILKARKMTREDLAQIVRDWTDD